MLKLALPQKKFDAQGVKAEKYFKYFKMYD